MLWMWDVKRDCLLTNVVLRLTGGGLPVEPHRVQTGDSDEQPNSVFLEAGRARMVSAPQSWCWRGAVMRRD